MNTFFFDISPDYFCVSFGAMLVISFIMNRHSRHFYTLHVFVRKFSMIDLELPASPLELVTYIKGIFKLPPALAKSSSQALKANLSLRFLLAPFAYGSLFLASMQLAVRLASFGHWLFGFLAWLQIIPLVCDVLETVYLLKRIDPGVEIPTPKVYKAFQLTALCKWACILVTVVFIVSTVLYLWLTGSYGPFFPHYLLIVASETIIYFALIRFTSKYPEINPDPYQNIGN